MKKNTWLIRILIPAIILSMVGIAFAAQPALFDFSPAAPAASADRKMNTREFTHDEEQSFRKVMGFYARLDSCRQLFIEGTIHAYDPVDSSNTMNDGFRFCRRGEELYYQVGDMEMFSGTEMYLAISHSAKKILLSAPKKLILPFHPPTDSLINLWKQENYQVVSSSSETSAIISLRCPNHATCKEYRFVFDTTGDVLKELYLRLTNLDDPLNAEMDKEINVSFKRWQVNQAPANLLKRNNYVVKMHNKWVPAMAYRGYELVSIR